MSGISLFASYLVNALWQVTVIAAAGWLATRFLGRLGPRAEHIGWVLTLAVAVLAPAAPLFRSLAALFSGQSSSGSNLSLVLVAVPQALQHRSGFYQWPVAAIWGLAGMSVAAMFYFACQMVWSLVRVCAMIAAARPQPLTAEQEEIWSRCQRLFALDGAQLMSSPEISGPVVAGARRPILIVPAGFAELCSGPDLLAALAHECAHAQRRDFQKNICYEAMSLVLAFHPAIWFVKARIAQTREMICDSMVAERMVAPHSYARSLLRLAAMVAAPPRTASVHAIGIFDANILEKRVMMIGTTRRHAGRVMRYGLTAVAALLLAYAGVFAAAKAIVIQPQSASAAGQSGAPENNTAHYGHVYKVGKDVTAPVPLNMVEAEFPKSGKSLKKGFQAIVVAGCVVDENGMPQDVHIWRSYNPDFDAEALKAVKRYRFKPAMRAGQPVAVSISIEVNFKKY